MIKRKVKPILIGMMFSLAIGNMIIEVKSNEEFPITPNDEFFTEAIDFFDIDPETYRLVVTGEVFNPLSLSLAEIKAMPVTSEIVRLTCVGYKFGATSYTGVANWTGVRLSYILNLSQIKWDKAVDISFHTPDLNPWAFSTSLNVTEAYWEDVILAYEMNGEPLPTEHGFPIRLVCPRFYGYKWIKWLMYINVITQDYRGYYENNGYNDSPYVDVPLQIYYSTQAYYSPFTSDSQWSRLESSPWPGLEMILTAITIVLIPRFSKKYRTDK